MIRPGSYITFFEGPFQGFYYHSILDNTQVLPLIKMTKKKQPKPFTISSVGYAI